MSNWLRKYAKKQETRAMNRHGFNNNTGTRRSVKRALDCLEAFCRAACTFHGFPATLVSEELRESEDGYELVSRYDVAINRPGWSAKVQL